MMPSPLTEGRETERVRPKRELDGEELEIIDFNTRGVTNAGVAFREIEEEQERQEQACNTDREYVSSTVMRVEDNTRRINTERPSESGTVILEYKGQKRSFDTRLLSHVNKGREPVHRSVPDDYYGQQRGVCPLRGWLKGRRNHDSNECLTIRMLWGEGPPQKRARRLHREDRSRPHGHSGV